MLTVHDVYFTLPGIPFHTSGGTPNWQISRNQFSWPEEKLEELYQPPIGSDMDPAFAAATADYLIAYRYILAAGSWRLIAVESNYPVDGFTRLDFGGNPLYFKRY